MDRLMNNHWFIKIFALLLALMLYMSVNIDKQTKPGGLTRNSVGNTDVGTVTEVPVIPYYDDENVVVSGIPQYVNVTLEGPTSILKPTELQRDFEIYVDLTNLGLGTHTVPIKYKNISEKLSVKIHPATINVVIQEKVSINFPVEVDFINKGKIAEGYSIQEPSVKPNVVRLTGAKDLIEKVALVKARVNVEGAKETIKQESRVAVYDEHGNILDLQVEPSVVEVTVPVESPSKSVPLKINRIGKLQNGLSIVKIEPVPSEVTIFGPKKQIEQIDHIDGITVNLDDITGNTVLEVDVPVPEGVKAVDPKKVKIYIEVQKEEAKAFSDLPVRILGLTDEYMFQFLNPESGKVNVNAYGTLSLLNALRTDDIDLYANVGELGTGEHEIPIQINGPRNIMWKLSQETVKITISKKEL